MSLSAAEIGKVVARCDAALKGGALRKVLSPSRPDRIVLEIRAGGDNHLLQLVVSATGSRIGRIAAKPKAAKQPHPFVMLLRGKAQGLRLVRLRQLGDDRALAIDLEGRERRGTLVCELTSRHANMFWIDDEDLIAGSFHINRSHKRRLVPGEPYTPPLPRSGSPAPAQRFPDGDDLEPRIEQHYAALEQQREVDARRVVVNRAARTATKRLERLLTNLEQDRARADEAERLRQQAFVLQANLGRVVRGMSELEASDFEGNPVRIVLDPALDLTANMQRLFERAKRLGRAAPRISERIDDARAWRDKVHGLAHTITGADAEQLEQILDELRSRFPDLVQRAVAKKRDRPERLPYREIPISAGRAARVGRSAADNDTLTLRFARPDDLWLHIRGRKGSHVVVPLGRGEEPTSDLLVDAAHLAAHYSDARGDTDVEISWTRRRYVQKPRGAPPGSVRVLKEKTIFLRVDQRRLARLLS
ncbi:MAG: NFACT family protein [Deltaproteobacteria bacterium]|nr:NFACT family protein [Deltaproteobacteria bacterium]